MSLPVDADLAALERRLGREALERRLKREALLVERKVHGRKILHDGTIRACIRASGLEPLMRRNFRAVRLVENRVRLRALAPEFHGFRILQISDLHCDLDPEVMRIAAGLASRVSCDAVVLTGDYHDRIGRCARESLALMLELIPSLPARAFCILGNHDFLSRVRPFEEAGLRVLLNENLVLERGAARLHLCGVDDPRFFQTHDLARARAGIPADATAILLAHSPEVAREAAALGYSLTLCGHTHGGQICLPGGYPVLLNAPVPRRLVAGPWVESGMPGYTSRGTGGCGVPARLFCPPEITLHVLEAPPGVRGLNPSISRADRS